MKRITSKYTNWNCACGHETFLDSKETAIRLAKIEDILGDEYDLDRLRELVQADKEGKIIIKLVQKGDSVYFYDGYLGKIREETVLYAKFVGETRSLPFEERDVGKVVFKTKAEVEESLKKALRKAFEFDKEIFDK